MTYRELSKFHQDMCEVNRRRRALKIIDFKLHLVPDEGPTIYRIEPMFQLHHPDVNFNMLLQE